MAISVFSNALPTTIFNLTMHDATPEQIAAGVVDLQDPERSLVRNLLTFTELPSSEELRERAREIAGIVLGIVFNQGSGTPMAMIGGAPFFMNPLENELRMRGIKPVHAFSVRDSVEVSMPDGSVRKTNVLRHMGFVDNRVKISRV